MVQQNESTRPFVLVPTRALTTAEITYLLADAGVVTTADGLARMTPKLRSQFRDVRVPNADN